MHPINAVMKSGPLNLLVQGGCSGDSLGFLLEGKLAHLYQTNILKLILRVKGIIDSLNTNITGCIHKLILEQLIKFCC